MQHSIPPWRGKFQLFRRRFCLYMYVYKANWCQLHNKCMYSVLLHFFLQLFSDEFCCMCSYFVNLVAKEEYWNIFLDHTCLCQDLIQVPSYKRDYTNQLSDIQCKLTTANVKYKQQQIISTLKQDGSLVKIPQNQPQTQRQLLEVGTHLVSA